jgi:hypothetical protein
MQEARDEQPPQFESELGPHFSAQRGKLGLIKLSYRPASSRSSRSLRPFRLQRTTPLQAPAQPLATVLPPYRTPSRLSPARTLVASQQTELAAESLCKLEPRFLQGCRSGQLTLNPLYYSLHQMRGLGSSSSPPSKYPSKPTPTLGIDGHRMVSHSSSARRLFGSCS